MKKVSIIGAGAVGSHIASASVFKNIPIEISLIDINEDLEAGQILDLRDALLFSHTKNIKGLDIDSHELSDEDIVVITAGAAQKPGETRIDLLEKNKGILSSLHSKMPQLKPSAIVILVANPVDLLTYHAQRIFDLPENQVFGTGTLLDTSRLKWHLSEKQGVHPENISGYVLGEHGDSSCVTWSQVQSAGKSIALSDNEKSSLLSTVQHEAYDIIDKKGATYFGIGAATAHIIETIVTDRKMILPVSTNPKGAYGIDNISISVPCVVGAGGIEKVWEIDIPSDELQNLQKSAQNLQNIWNGKLE